MLAPKPRPKVNGFNPSESNEDVRAEVRDTLARIRKKAATGRLSGDSALFRMKKKLTDAVDVGEACEAEAVISDVEAVADDG